jgi:L-arabinonolactonase
MYMQDMQATLLIDGRHILGECVLWCSRSQSVYWTDIHAKKLWRLHPQSNVLRHWDMPERLASFAFTHDQRYLLLGLASRLAWFDLDTETVIPICDVEAALPTTRLNDGRCDRQGRFVFGTLNEDASRAPIARFYRLHADLRLEALPLPTIAIANSICFSPAGDRMYFCDSMHKAIWYCDYGQDGAIGTPEIFADLSSQAGSADGSIVDRDGYLWNAQWGGAKVVRYDQKGNVDREIELPVTQPSCVAFGGDGLSRLFITTARENLDAAALSSQPLAGGLFYADIADVSGLDEIWFAGAVPDAQ